MNARQELQHKINRFVILTVALSLGGALGFIGGLIVGSLRTLKILEG